MLLSFNDFFGIIVNYQLLTTSTYSEIRLVRRICMKMDERKLWAHFCDRQVAYLHLPTWKCCLPSSQLQLENNKKQSFLKMKEIIRYGEVENEIYWIFNNLSRFVELSSEECPISCRANLKVKGFWLSGCRMKEPKRYLWHMTYGNDFKLFLEVP